MNEQLDLFHVEQNPAPEPPPRQQRINPSADGEQLEAFEIATGPETQSAHYMQFWDRDGLQIVGLIDNYYPYRSGDKEARAKSLAKVRKRFDQLIATGLVHHAQISTTETHIAEYQYIPHPLTIKRWPDSSIKIDKDFFNES